jgi:hypothetical protein
MMSSGVFGSAHRPPPALPLVWLTKGKAPPGENVRLACCWEMRALRTSPEPSSWPPNRVRAKVSPGVSGRSVTTTVSTSASCVMTGAGAGAGFGLGAATAFGAGVATTGAGAAAAASVFGFLYLSMNPMIYSLSFVSAGSADGVVGLRLKMWKRAHFQ